MYLIYSQYNDIFSLVHHNNFLQFSGDTTIKCKDTCENVEKLSHNLELISKWISQSKMWLNVMWFSSKHRKRKPEYPPVMIDDQPLTAVTQQCYLGIVINDLSSVKCLGF